MVKVGDLCPKCSSPQPSAEAAQDATDYLGAALALEAEFHKPESQTMLRAMEHAARALRIAHNKYRGTPEQEKI